MLVHRIAGGLHHKYIYAAHVLEQLEEDLAVGKALQLGFADLDADMLADRVGQLGIRRAAEQLEALVIAQVAWLLALRRRSFESCRLSLSPRLAPRALFAALVLGGLGSPALLSPTVNVPVSI